MIYFKLHYIEHTKISQKSCCKNSFYDEVRDISDIVFSVDGADKEENEDWQSYTESSVENEDWQSYTYSSVENGLINAEDEMTRL